MPSIENVLQDGSPEPCGRSQPGAPADIYLPGKGAVPEARRGRHTWGWAGGAAPEVLESR